MKGYIGIILSAAIGIGLVLGLSHFMNKVREESCYLKWENAQWDKRIGCMVNMNGDYIPEKNVMVIKWEYIE